MRRDAANTLVETKCLACGNQVTESVGRFAKKPEPICPSCGGKLDLAPLRKLVLSAAKGARAMDKIMPKRGDLPKK